jgi:hypothetical protein
MITFDDMRGYAMVLPEVEEKSHFRLPGFRVADKLLAHLEKGDKHAIVCVSQDEAKAASAEKPDVYQEVWRDKRMQELIEHAWRNRAPKRLVKEYDSR